MDDRGPIGGHRHFGVWPPRLRSGPGSSPSLCSENYENKTFNLP